MRHFLARHVELSKTDHLLYLFDPTLAQGLGSGSCSRHPIDLWTGLNSLTLRGLHPRRPEPNQFSAWLVDRQALGLRRFHVKLIYFSRNDRSNPSIDFNFLLLYEILELD